MHKKVDKAKFNKINSKLLICFKRISLLEVPSVFVSRDTCASTYHNNRHLPDKDPFLQNKAAQYNMLS
jgi:hypothetical protein